MRLFISYARVDRSACKQIVEILEDAHEVWYDKRLHAGQQWWDEILEHLDWYEGLMYLLSPESAASEYCRKECDIALSAGKCVVPVVIQPRTVLPEFLSHIQYADIGDDLNSAETARALLSAITVAERKLRAAKPLAVERLSPEQIARPDGQTSDLAAVIAQAVAAMESEDYDKAVFLWKQAVESGYKTRYVNPADMLQQAEAELERQARRKEAEREYAPIARLVKAKATRGQGCPVFARFRQDFPDYDPEGLAAICAEYEQASKAAPPVGAVREPPLQTPAQASLPDVTRILPPPFEWCDIPAGQVTLEDASSSRGTKGGVYQVERFFIAKFPVTNQQYQVFVSAKDGYNDPQWWAYSDAARDWRAKNKKPKGTAFKGDDLPRTDVSWYDAIAFCGWLTQKTGRNVILPTEQQWQRAAQGDDGRAYPWGNQFDKSKCNTRESGIRQTTPVTKYRHGASPYGVMDMAGNVWEWCRTQWGDDNIDITSGYHLVMRGGSWQDLPDRARAVCRTFSPSHILYYPLGFRLALLPPD